MTSDRDFDVAAYHMGLEEGRREAAAYIDENSRLRVKIEKLRIMLETLVLSFGKELNSK